MRRRWDSPLDPPIRPVTSWPTHEREPVQLRLIEHDQDVPQLYRPQEPPQYPADLVAFTDRLHDHGLVELGLQVLAQYTRMERLIAFSRFILEAEG